MRSALRSALVALVVLAAVPVCAAPIEAVRAVEPRFMRIVSDEDFEARCIDTARPVVVLFHGGQDSALFSRIAPSFERFAAVFGHRLDVYAYDMSRQRRWHDRLHAGGIGNAVLLYHGQVFARAFDFIDDGPSILGRLVMLTDLFILPDCSIGRFPPAFPLPDESFEVHVLEAERPVVIAFEHHPRTLRRPVDRSRLRSPTERRQPVRQDPSLRRPTRIDVHLSSLSQQYGQLFHCFIGEDEQLRRRLSVGDSATLILFTGGREVVRYHGPWFGYSNAMKARVLGVLLPHLPRLARLAEPIEVVGGLEGPSAWTAGADRPHFVLPRRLNRTRAVVTPTSR